MVALSVSQQSKSLNRHHPKKVVIIGDSLVYGFGDTEGGGWVERLRRQWMDPDRSGPILYNLGVRGDGVQQITQRLEAEFRLRGELRRRVPDFIVLSVGLNDSARLGRPNGRRMLEASGFAREIETLLDKAQQLCPVFFIGMVPVNEAAMPYAETLYFSRADQACYKEITDKACETRGVPYFDVYAQWLSNGDAWCNARLCSDGLHPNVLGYRTLCRDIWGWQPLMRALNA